jgi:hypothetical protein
MHFASIRTPSPRKQRWALRSSKNRPESIGRTCEVWSNGEDSAMWAVFRRQPFAPRKLHQEVMDALSIGFLTEARRAELLELQTWSVHHIALGAAEAQLRKVAAAKRLAIRDAVLAGMRAEEAELIFARDGGGTWPSEEEAAPPMEMRNAAWAGNETSCLP